MSVELSPEQPRKPLDYSVKLPPVLKVEHIEWDKPRIVEIPLYSEEDSPDRLYTLKEVFKYFDDFVERVIKVTAAMKKSKFDAAECAEILNYYYDDDWEEPDTFPSQNVNYYYALQIPQLRAAELALEMLERPDMWNMDVTAARRKLHVSKLKLWQVLPDFYKGHANPMPKPLSYNVKKPYPHLCSEESLFEHENGRLREHWRAVEQFQNFRAYLPDEDANYVSTLSISEHPYGVMLKSSSGLSIFLDLNTYDAPPLRILDFIEQILTNDEPAYTSYDPEGSEYEMLSASACRQDLVRLLIINEGYEGKCGLITGLFNRRELVRVLLEIPTPDGWDLPNEQLAKIPPRLKKIKEMM